MYQALAILSVNFAHRKLQNTQNANSTFSSVSGLGFRVGTLKQFPGEIHDKHLHLFILQTWFR